MRNTALALALLLGSYGASAQDPGDYSDTPPIGVVTSSKLQIHVSSLIMFVQRLTFIIWESFNIKISQPH